MSAALKTTSAYPSSAARSVVGIHLVSAVVQGEAGLVHSVADESLDAELGLAAVVVLSAAQELVHDVGPLGWREFLVPHLLKEPVRLALYEIKF